jgi:hypothetical protein
MSNGTQKVDEVRRQLASIAESIRQTGDPYLTVQFDAIAHQSTLDWEAAEVALDKFIASAKARVAQFPS